MFRDVPCGTGGEGPLRIDQKQFEAVLVQGAQWMVENGYGDQRDAELCEENGRLEGADPGKVSEQAKERGRPQLGTLGSGNHFLEVQYVEEIHDAEAARAMGLELGQAVVLVHCGSRGLGHQVCTDYLAEMGAAMKRYNITLPDRQLACVPIQSPEGQAYLAAMRASANFAWANRQAILHFLRGSFRQVFGSDAQAEPGLRRLPQHRQAGAPRGGGAEAGRAGAPQGRHAGLPSRPSRGPGGLPPASASRC